MEAGVHGGLNARDLKTRWGWPGGGAHVNVWFESSQMFAPPPPPPPPPQPGGGCILFYFILLYLLFYFQRLIYSRCCAWARSEVKLWIGLAPCVSHAGRVVDSRRGPSWNGRKRKKHTEAVLSSGVQLRSIWVVHRECKCIHIIIIIIILLFFLIIHSMTQASYSVFQNLHKSLKSK